MRTAIYENLIIGSGAGGKLLAWHLAKSGQQTAVVERRWVGGSCPNVNRLPSKNEIWSAKVADLVHHANKFGISTGPVSIDMAAVRRRKREMAEELIAMHLDNYKANGAELIMGEAKFVGSKTVEVHMNEDGMRTPKGERIFLNVGTHALIPSVPGLAECRPMTNIEALELDRLPEQLIVIGGGYVGLEFAQAYRRFGSRVTIIQHGPQLLEREDPDVAAEIQQTFTEEGTDIVTLTEIASVQGRSGAGVSLVVRTSAKEKTILGGDILIATGRTPNTVGIGLELAGVELDQRGYVRVNDRLQTTAPNVWAMGECAGSPQFTHASEDDFHIILDNLNGGHRTTRDRIIPYCLFTDPQVAHVQLSEREARRRGVAARVVRFAIAGVLRALTTSETRGLMKALIDPKDDLILGFTMVGPEAGEVVAVVQTAMLAGSSYKVLRDAIFSHPTMTEGLEALFSSIEAANTGHRE